MVSCIDSYIGLLLLLVLFSCIFTVYECEYCCCNFDSLVMCSCVCFFIHTQCAFGCCWFFANGEVILLQFAACLFFFFKQKTADEMRISDWSSDVCSSD